MITKFEMMISLSLTLTMINLMSSFSNLVLACLAYFVMMITILYILCIIILSIYIIIYKYYKYLLIFKIL